MPIRVCSKLAFRFTEFWEVHAQDRVHISCAHAPGAAPGGSPPNRRNDRMRDYRDNWFKVGTVLALAIASVLALSGRRLSRPRLFSALNLAALMIHQFEEYAFPG